MSTINTATPCLSKLDPLKRVNYTFGLVLGVDEFLQEQTYLIEKNRLHNSLLHGYGTVWGLRVEVPDKPTPNPEVRVTPGVAVNPQGQEIYVPRSMCWKPNEWLGKKRTALQELHGSPPFPVSLCAVLCYRECGTDEVPVPGEPCRTQEDAMAPSRITESFELLLCLNREQPVLSPPVAPPPKGVPYRKDDLMLYCPSQVEEDAVREFGSLLNRTEITTGATDYLTTEEFENEVRSIGEPVSSPPVSSPPGGGPVLYLHPDEACEILRSGFRVWVTEVRPKIITIAESAECESLRERCVLLGGLNFEVNSNWQVAGLIEVDEARRPYLLHTRLLQEWLQCGRPGSVHPGNGGVTDHGELTGLNDDDHPQYLDTSRGDARYALFNHTHVLGTLSDVKAPTPGDDKKALTWVQANGQWEPRTVDGGATGPAGGDLTGTYPDPTIQSLQNRKLAADNPGDGDVLTWNDNASQWEPQQPQPGGKFVLAPGEETYSVVAAGRFKANGTQVGPPYNKLEAKAEVINRRVTGVYDLRFLGYKKPPARGPKHMYIVRGTPEIENEYPGHSFEVLSFEAEFIKVRIKAPDDGQVKHTGFMVEISQIGG